MTSLVYQFNVHSYEGVMCWSDFYDFMIGDFSPNKEAAEKWTSDQIEEAFGKVDESKDRKITLEEYLNFLNPPLGRLVTALKALDNTGGRVSHAAVLEVLESNTEMDTKQAKEALNGMDKGEDDTINLNDYLEKL